MKMITANCGVLRRRGDDPRKVLFGHIPREVYTNAHHAVETAIDISNRYMGGYITRQMLADAHNAAETAIEVSKRNINKIWCKGKKNRSNDACVGYN